MICGDQVYDGTAENSWRAWTNFESQRERADDKRPGELVAREFRASLSVQLGL